MFLVMGITGKVGGATAEHLLAHGKEVRALVRNREKASSWANQGVELVDGEWNDSAAIERALKDVEGAFVMLPSVLKEPSPDYKEAKGVIANYVEALTKARRVPGVHVIGRGDQVDLAADVPQHRVRGVLVGLVLGRRDVPGDHQGDLAGGWARIPRSLSRCL